MFSRAGTAPPKWKGRGLAVSLAPYKHRGFRKIVAHPKGLRARSADLAALQIMNSLRTRQLMYAGKTPRIGAKCPREARRQSGRSREAIQFPTPEFCHLFTVHSSLFTLHFSFSGSRKLSATSGRGCPSRVPRKAVPVADVARRGAGRRGCRPIRSASGAWR